MWRQECRGWRLRWELIIFWSRPRPANVWLVLEFQPDCVNWMREGWNQWRKKWQGRWNWRCVSEVEAGADEPDLNLAMCGWRRNAGHTADHHDHRGCQDDSEAQAAERELRKSSKVASDVEYIPLLGKLSRSATKLLKTQVKIHTDTHRSQRCCKTPIHFQLKQTRYWYRYKNHQ